MADQKISQLTELTNPNSNDFIPIVSGGETKKITVANLAVAGSSGTSGTSGSNGSSGTSGSNGSSGTSGVNGTSGSSGSNGSSGTSGTSGTSGSSGTSGTVNYTGLITTGSALTTQNITGSLVVSGSATFNVSALVVSARAGDEGGEINLAIPVTNTSLESRVNVDIWQNRFRIFEGSANAKGVFVDLSKAPNGVGGELIWKTSGLLNTGSFVQLDNVKAGPTRNGAGGGFAGLSIGAVSTTFVADISATYANNTIGGTTATAVTYTTTAANSAMGWGFTQGQHSTYILNDTTNSRVYRIILMVGASYNNNLTSIERLY